VAPLVETRPFRVQLSCRETSDFVRALLERNVPRSRDRT
jgi:hypothetical protein